MRNENDKCILEKSIEIKDEDVFFEFWYHMWGFYIGTLELIAGESVLWSMTGSQEDNWLRTEVKLPAGKYQVYILEKKKSIQDKFFEWQ